MNFFKNYIAPYKDRALALGLGLVIGAGVMLGFSEEKDLREKLRLAQNEITSFLKDNPDKGQMFVFSKGTKELLVIPSNDKETLFKFSWASEYGLMGRLETPERRQPDQMPAARDMIPPPAPR